jgi:anaerobic magnesium-protoporphyrin IX monomethyl ester cyclase
MITMKDTQKPGRAEDVVLIINPSLWYKPMYPTGILCLSNYLEAQGMPNMIIDSRLFKGKIGIEKGRKLIIDTVRNMKPKLVGFSSTHAEFDEVIKMNMGIRELGSSILSIVGGAQPTFRSSDFLDNGFDFVCIGEGERTLHEFAVEVIHETNRWGKISGLVYRDRGKIYKNRSRAFLTETELGVGEFSAYGKIDKRYFDFNVEIIRGLPLRGGLLLTTRGCPYSCSFCGCNAIFGRSLRFRPIEDIELELIHLKEEFRVEGIWIIDDTFIVNKNHAFLVAELLKKHGMIWGCQSRVDTIDRSTMEYLKRCGCVQIDFGVESGSQRILDEIIGKGTNVGQVENAFALAKEYGMRTLANFIIGLPTETLKDLEATKRVAKSISSDVYVFSIATPLPGTRLYDLVGEDIAPHQYAQLNWNGSRMTARLNKSFISDVIKEKTNLKRNYLFRSMLRSIFARKELIGLMLKKEPIGRINAALRFVLTHLLGSP